MNDSRFADRLLAADPAGRRPADAETVLGPVVRWVILFVAIAVLGITALLAYTAVIADEPGNPVVAYFRALCLLSAGVTGLSAGLLVRMVWRGTSRKPRSNAGAVEFVAGYLSLAGGLTLSLAGHVPTLPDVRVLGGLTVVAAATLWVRSRVARAEQHLTERLLELELRLAEVQEAVRAGRSASADTRGP
ncbi:MAG: hypothetical protein K2V38_01440 [Gemmataceae bacterium]|nr:hypothetical protein [Gemmataceae bacterium]